VSGLSSFLSLLDSELEVVARLRRWRRDFVSGRSFFLPFFFFSFFPVKAGCISKRVPVPYLCAAEIHGETTRF